MSRKFWLLVLIVGVVSIPVAFAAVSVSRGHRIYRYQIRYDRFPASDAPPATWLEEQPGVERVEARHDSLWLYLNVHTYKRYPSPDVFAACEQFGYQGQGSSRASVVRPLW